MLYTAFLIDASDEKTPLIGVFSSLALLLDVAADQLDNGQHFSVQEMELDAVCKHPLSTRYTIKDGAVALSDESSSCDDNGFFKPFAFEEEFCNFLGLPPSEQHSRVEVTRRLCEYIGTHKLNKSSDKRYIIPDEALGKIIGSMDELTYYQLQKTVQKYLRV